MLADEMATFFQAQGIGTPATTLFVGSVATLPAGAGPFTRISEYGGEGQIRGMGAMVVAEQPRVQIMVHAQTYAAARTKAEAAYKACLHATDAGPRTLSGTTYLSITPLQSPFDIGADANGRVMIAFNCAVQKKVSP